MNRITGSNYEDSLRAQIVNETVSRESLHSRFFYFGQVISNSDPKNLNRIKVRIPVIDDVFYVEKTKDDGDTSLPFCLPISHRFVEIPEVNSIIIVSIFDTKTPYYGRIYFDTITDLSDVDIFDRTSPETTSLSNWDNLEKSLNVKVNAKPPDNSFNSKENINYKTGIRGKGKNKFVLDKESSYWYQNFGDPQNESSITQSKNIDINSSDLIKILSKKGSNTYHPIFDQPLYDYLSSINSLLQKIVVLLNTIPARAPDGPCMPSKSASQLITQLQKLSTDFKRFKDIGHSKKISIN